VNLIAVWRAQGLAGLLEEALAAGTIFCGVSAGALCWYERGVTDSYGPGLNPLLDGLGVLEGAFCPHYDSDPRRPAAFRAFVAGHGGPGLAADDGVAFHYVDGRLARVVSSRPDARAVRLDVVDGEVAGRIIRPEYLG
jgi:peptidase E